MSNNMRKSPSPHHRSLEALSLEQASRRFPTFEKKIAYLFNVRRTNGQIEYIFGLVGNSTMVKVNEDAYKAIGSPNINRNIEVSYILERAGYKPIKQ